MAVPRFRSTQALGSRRFPTAAVPDAAPLAVGARRASNRFQPCKVPAVAPTGRTLRAFPQTSPQARRASHFRADAVPAPRVCSEPGDDSVPLSAPRIRRVERSRGPRRRRLRPWVLHQRIPSFIHTFPPPQGLLHSPRSHAARDVCGPVIFDAAVNAFFCALKEQYAVHYSELGHVGGRGSVRCAPPLVFALRAAKVGLVARARSKRRLRQCPAMPSSPKTAWPAATTGSDRRERLSFRIPTPKQRQSRNRLVKIDLNQTNNPTRRLTRSSFTSSVTTAAPGPGRSSRKTLRSPSSGQPDWPNDFSTGLIDWRHWAPSATWDTTGSDVGQSIREADAPDAALPAGASPPIVFIVPRTTRWPSGARVQTSDTTLQAYHQYAGWRATTLYFGVPATIPS